MREKVGVELWWTLNLAGCGVGGVLMSLLGCMGWGYGRILRGVGGSFLILPNLRWEMAPRLRVWHDLWGRPVGWARGDMVLKEAFPVLYGFVCAKYASIATHLELSGGSN
jgi:hypothetical protein